MLNIYYGRENLDKDKFLFEKIGEQEGKTLLLVPEQFTLQAERNAFAYLGVEGLMDLEIISQSRLGFQVLKETGGSKRGQIDKYGRHMLLAKILMEEEENLQTFKGMSRVHSFIDMTNNLISEMKQFSRKPADLLEIIECNKADSILTKKLKDIYLVYEKYEGLIAGKYTDTEDYLDLFIEKIGQSQNLRQSEVWVSGFDYFTPKNVEVLEGLMKRVKNLNVVMTSWGVEQSDQPWRDLEICQITRDIIFKLQSSAEHNHIKCSLTAISTHYGTLSELDHLEKELFAYPSIPYVEDMPGIRLCAAANFYSEAESAATFILQLVREEKLRYRDIVVICNDMESRASIIKRIFADYGINCFIDKKRNILHNPIVEFVMALLDTVSAGWSSDNIFRILKTGLTPISKEDCCSLENYTIKYRIKGGKWQRDFKYGRTEKGEETLEKINEIRQRVWTYLEPFEQAFKKSSSAREKTVAIYEYLTTTIELPERIEEFIRYLEDQEEQEYALETEQVWDVLMGILDQVVRLLGEEKIENRQYSDFLKSGLEAVEIGIIPPTLDQVTVGTMQRTRAGNVKALVVIGANDGLLPSTISSEGLLNEDEKMKLLNKGLEICKIDDLRVKEEQLAIYKTFSQATDHLWMAYSATDMDGRESKPSMIFERVRKIFPCVKVEKDIVSEGKPLELISTADSTLKHITQAFREGLEGAVIPAEWQKTYHWYKGELEQRKKIFPMEAGLFFTNEEKNMEKELVERLYKNKKLSPSKLERFSRCPFSYFVNYGLAPDERRIFEVAGREMGDIYHETIMRLSEKLTIAGIQINNEDSPWMKVNEVQCQSYVDDIMEVEMGSYREGILSQGEEERYRADRMKKVCGQAAWSLVRHVQQGHVEQVFFESKFGSDIGSIFQPITVPLGDKVFTVEGKIDRVDILEGDYVKIIDYKSGKEKFDLKEVEGGWKLQLMVYLNAATQYSSLEKEQRRKPAGVFYFEIAEPSIDATAMTKEAYKEKVQGELKKSFKLDGIVVDESSVIEGIAGEFTGYSDTIPIRKSKEGTFSGTSENKLLSLEEFQQLQDVVSKKVAYLCQEMMEGKIAIKPKKTKSQSACTYCQYKGVCNFDLAFDGCVYDMVK